MGLLDFFANIDKKVFGSEAEASTAIKKSVEEDNPGIDNFHLAVVPAFPAKSNATLTSVIFGMPGKQLILMRLKRSNSRLRS